MATRKARGGVSAPPDEAAALAAKALDHRSDGQYKIIRGTDFRDLADAVNENIEKGWVPIGGHVVEAPSMNDMLDPQKVPHPWSISMVFKP